MLSPRSITYLPRGASVGALSVGFGSVARAHLRQAKRMKRIYLPHQPPWPIQDWFEEFHPTVSFIVGSETVEGPDWSACQSNSNSAPSVYWIGREEALEVLDNFVHRQWFKRIVVDHALSDEDELALKLRFG
jgi:hypothetical protein